MAPKQSAATGRGNRSDAEVAEIDYTAFTSRPKAKHVTARLIVRRVTDMIPNNQSELCTAYRYHAVFTNSPLSTLEAEKAHRAHVIVEQVIADLKNGPLAHLPSGQFAAFNLTRAAGVLASTFHAKATAGTIRAQLITLPGRLARSARQLTLHLPTGWPWQTAWHELATAANSPPLSLPDHHPPSNRTRPDTAVETAGPPGHLDAPSPGQEQDHATSMITKGPTVHPGFVVLRFAAPSCHDIITTAAGSRSHS